MNNNREREKFYKNMNDTMRAFKWLGLFFILLLLFAYLCIFLEYGR